MKRGHKWALTALALAALATVAAIKLTDQKKQQQQLTAATQSAKAQPVVELAPGDVVLAQTRELTMGLPISGTLKAVNSAVVKARVAGELQSFTVREGDFVKAGQVIGRIDNAEYSARLQQAEQQADAAKAQREIAQRQLDNNKALVDQGFISRTALDTSSANLNAAQATYRAALAGAEVARKSLNDTVVKAPLSGQVSQRAAQAGERVGIDARIVEIVDLSRLELEVAVSAAESLTLKPGQMAQLQIEGSPTKVSAKLVRTNPSAQPSSRSILAYLSVDPAAVPGLALRQGLFVQGILGTATTSGLAIPLNAVRSEKPKPYVQVVEDNRVVHKQIEPGTRGQVDEDTMVMVTGLAEKTVVLKGSVGPVMEGATVRFTKALEPASAPARENLAPKTAP